MTRSRLPTRRECDAIAFTHADVDYIGKVSRFANGSIAEVFLSPGVKSGTALAHMVAALSVTASLALQHGCELETLCDALPRMDDGSPGDPLGALLGLVERE